MAWWCGEARLPEIGGVLDQDAGLWGRMQSLNGVYRLVSRVQRLHGDKIHTLSPGELRAIRQLRDQGLWDG